MKVDRILLIDDDDALRKSLSDLLKAEGYTVQSVGSELQAREAVQKDEFDLILADLILPTGSCMEYLRWVRQVQPQIQFIIMTGFASVESAIEALRLGVFNYLLKPINPQELLVTLQRLESYEKMAEENAHLRKEISRESNEKPIWGRCPAMQEVSQIIDRVAPTDATVLIQGESGTGKEVVASEIYLNSTRSQQPFIKVNCAALPETLLETELFGHERGAFTGAVQRKIGCFEMANGGTIFLDEIGDVSLGIQSKILKAIQNQEICRVGGEKQIKINVRVVASTNRDLGDLVRSEGFREDLYYLLNVVPITLPPLRTRGDDIDDFCDYFLKRFTQKHGKKINGFSLTAKQKLHTYGWPGNLRELQNVIERAVILAVSDTTFDDSDFVLTVSPKDNGSWVSGPLPTIAEMEMRLIALMLKRTDNNKSQTARQLGVSVRTIRNKLEEYERKGFNITAIADASERSF